MAKLAKTFFMLYSNTMSPESPFQNNQPLEQKPNLKELPDKELVAIFQDGNEKAFEEITKRYTKVVGVIIYRIINDKEKTKDLIQSTFVKVLEALKNNAYEDLGVFEYWIKTTAKNTALDYYRQQRRLRDNIAGYIVDSVFEFAHDDSKTGYKERIVYQEVLDAVHHLLSFEEIKCIQLRIEGKKHEEIAKEVGGSTNNIKTKIWRIKNKIKKFLNQNPEILKKIENRLKSFDQLTVEKKKEILSYVESEKISEATKMLKRLSRLDLKEVLAELEPGVRSEIVDEWQKPD